jgi:hypothetical protein
MRKLRISLQRKLYIILLSIATLALKMETVRFSETLASTYESTRSQIQSNIVNS